MTRSIGIVGGAGPHAGALLYEMIIRVCQERYGSWRDGDFPFMMLLNVPFSDMLEAPDAERVQAELKAALDLLERNGLERVAIACNTLHGFLPSELGGYEFVDLRSVVPAMDDEVLILCTSTSRRRGVYGHLKGGVYLSEGDQRLLDGAIDAILAGKVDSEVAEGVAALVKPGQRVLLGCTELSLLHARCPLKLERVIDPLFLLAEKILEE